MKQTFLFLYLFFLCNSIFSQSCRTRDSLALVALYNSTSGPNWVNTWNLTMPIDSWYGVSLDGNQCVTCLELDGNVNPCSPFGLNSGNNLQGTIPSAIADMTDIEHLLLGDNNLSGTIPAAVWGMANLKDLDLSDNNLEGSIPAAVQGLVNVERLLLNNNAFTGELPQEVGLLSKLKWLYLGPNNFSGTLPGTIGDIQGLTNLVIQYANFSGDLPPELGYLSNLSELRLNNNNFSGCFPWSYTYLCDLPSSFNFNFTNNPGLPGGGDYQGFCSIQTGICNATCTDGFKNGDETGVDCGGAVCPSCNLHPLENWLGEHAAVAQAIRWNVDKENGTVLPYNLWHDSLKLKLNNLYDDLVSGIYPDFTDPLPNITQNTGSTTTVLLEADACTVYFSFLATSLYHEINNDFAWSVLGYSQESLDVLYDWNEYLAVSNNSTTGYVNEFTVNLTSTPSPPGYLMTNFINTYEIIEDNPKYAYAKILDWARDSLIHYAGGATQYYSHWQYYGPPPMSRLIDGTTRISDGRFSHYTAGCHGTVCFTKWVGFLLNIPVIDDYVGIGHRIAVLPSIGHDFITHGDDPYSGSSKNPPIAGRHLLVDSLHFFNFFGNSEYSPELNVNVGRRTNEIAFNTLPLAYKGAYCQDYLNNGNTEEDNYLANNYAGLVNTFSTILMDSIHFWDRLHLALKNDPGYDWCFSGYPEPINYAAFAPAWEYLGNGVVNPDSSIYKIAKTAPMRGKTSTCLASGNWVEMVIYNTVSETWLGIDPGVLDITLNEMDYAIRVQDNVVDVFENGTWKATLQDSFKLSVNWLKILVENNVVRYALNGFVRYTSLTESTGNYFMYFGAEEEEAEINNFYCSVESTTTCCVETAYVNYTAIPDNTYKAVNVVISTGLVPVNGNVLFESGNEILLNAGFEVQAGAVFEAKIQACQ